MRITKVTVASTTTSWSTGLPCMVSDDQDYKGYSKVINEEKLFSVAYHFELLAAYLFH